MAIYNPRIVYPPEADGIPMSEEDLHELGEEIGDNPNELSPFELQYLAEYSARDNEEALFYEQGEPTCNLKHQIHSWTTQMAF